MNEMKVRIVTPDQVVYEGIATRVRVYGLTANFTLLPRHAPLVEILSAGELQIDVHDSEEIYIGIGDGILEIADNQVNILVQQASQTDEKGKAIAQMKREKRKRKEETDQLRIQLIKSEMELYRLLRKANEAR